MTEEFRPIPSVPHYEASNLGRIRSARSGKILKCSIHPTGYLKVHTSVYGSERTFLVHRLVLLAFRGLPPTADHDALYSDGIKTNNVLENLRWGTPFENAQDAKMHGVVIGHPGDKHPMRKITKEEAQKIRRLKKTNPSMPYREIGALFGIGKTQAGDIVRGKYWREEAGPAALNTQRGRT